MLENNYPPWISSASFPEEQLHYLQTNDFLNSNQFEDYEINGNLESILNSKRVACVGPSQHLKQEETGELIDSYDVVIRLGQLFPISENLKKHYGSKSDVLFHSFNHLEIKEARRNLDYLKTFKHISCTMVSHNFAREHNEFFEEIRKMGLNVENIKDNYIFKLFREVGTTCNCGYVGINILLKYNIKELYVTGMNFYNMGTYGKIYNEEYYDNVTCAQTLYKQNEEKDTSAIQARSDLHNQGQQIRHFRNLYNEHKEIIVLDKYLSENLFK